MNAREELASAVNFILRVTNRGPEARLKEADFDKMSDLFMEKVDAYLLACRPCVPPNGSGARCEAPCPSDGGAPK